MNELDDPTPNTIDSSQHSGYTPNLPKVVWLRGDESYFHEFQLDADAVMQTLGIRRSRLTQISGKELRVGRTRVDRYIRPVYRPCDIEEYLNWTRPTASHKKSSSVLQQAADKLANESKELATQPKEQFEDWQTSLAQMLGQLSKKSWQWQKDSLNQHFNDVTEHLQEGEQRNRRALNQVREDLVHIHHKINRFEQCLEPLASIPDGIAKALSSIQYLEKAFINLQKEQGRFSTLLAEGLEELHAKLASLDKPREPITAPKPHHRINPRRRTPIATKLPCSTTCTSSLTPIRRSQAIKRRATKNRHRPL